MRCVSNELLTPYNPVRRAYFWSHGRPSLHHHHQTKSRCACELWPLFFSQPSIVKPLPKPQPRPQLQPESSSTTIFLTPNRPPVLSITIYLSGNVSPEMTKVSAKKPQPPAPFPATLNQLPDLDLQYRPGSSRTTRRRIRSPARVRRVAAPVGKRSRPETPLLKWKVEEPVSGANGVREELQEEEEEDEKKLLLETSQRGRCGGTKGRKVVVSARKLAAGIWRLQLQEAVASEGRTDGLRRKDELLGFQVTFACFSRFWRSEMFD